MLIRRTRCAMVQHLPVILFLIIHIWNKINTLFKIFISYERIPRKYKKVQQMEKKQINIFL